MSISSRKLSKGSEGLGEEIGASKSRAEEQSNQLTKHGANADEYQVSDGHYYREFDQHDCDPKKYFQDSESNSRGS
jgi:hypothetical protein